MNNKLFVGNLPFSITESELTEVFSQSGTVASASIVTDRDTGRARGFGFVEMSTQDEAEAAIRALDGRNVGGRNISVRVSEQKPRTGGGGGGGYGRDRR